jgi:preprotein translocase subunit YajC
MQYIIFMMGSPVGGAAGQQANPIMSLMPLVLMFGVLYFLMIRPQQKRAKDHKKMLEALQKNDTVITSGGIRGTVTNVKDDTATVRIADNVKVDFIKSSITQVQKSSAE